MPKYKYSGSKTKAHPKGDFRIEKPRLVKSGNRWRWIKGCDEFTGGKWEGFVAMPGGEYKTKTEALKHRPKW